MDKVSLENRFSSLIVLGISRDVAPVGTSAVENFYVGIVFILNLVLKQKRLVTCDGKPPNLRRGLLISPKAPPVSHTRVDSAPNRAGFYVDIRYDYASSLVLEKYKSAIPQYLHRIDSKRHVLGENPIICWREARCRACYAHQIRCMQSCELSHIIPRTTIISRDRTVMVITRLNKGLPRLLDRGT